MFSLAASCEADRRPEQRMRNTLGLPIGAAELVGEPDLLRRFHEFAVMSSRAYATAYTPIRLNAR